MFLNHPFLMQQFVEFSAERNPAAPFLIQLDKVSTYAEIDANANRMARLLRETGVKSGDRVAMLIANSPVYAVAYYGILKAGGIVVSLNTSATSDLLAHYLRDSGAEVLVVGARMENRIAAVLHESPGVRVVLAERPEQIGKAKPGTDLETVRIPGSVRIENIGAGLAAQSSERPDPHRISLDLAAIVYTSGSTGLPRGAMLSHGNLIANTQSIVEYLRLSNTDRVMAILPFYYVYGKTLLNTHAAVGGSVVIENRSVFPNVVLDSLETNECSGFAGVPSTYAILVNRSDLAERPLTHLRYLTQAGAAMAPELTRRLMAAVPGKQIFVMYGATEASARLTYLPPEELSRKLGSIGKAIPNVEITIRKDDGSEAGIDDVGEIVARGSNIMRGYWNDPESTARVLDSQGAYHTGDLGRRDSEGFLFVVGRKTDMLKVGGHRIAAKSIEEAVSEHHAIHETAVIGVSDELLGEAVCVFAVLREGHELAQLELSQFLQDRLPEHAMPKFIHFRDSLPKNESGKIMKQALREEMTGK